MKILALDAAEYKVGWCVTGPPGEKPRVGVHKLRKDGERTEEAVERLAVWVDDTFFTVSDNRPELVVMEKYIPHGALKGFTTAATRDGAILIHGAIRAVCALRACQFRAPAVQTIRKHFCGNGFADKDAVVRMAQILHYLEMDDFDTDKADAAALYDFASSHYASRAASFALT